MRNVLRAIDQDSVDENEPLAIIQSVWLQESIVTLKFIMEKNQRQRDAMSLFSQIQTSLNQLTGLKVGGVFYLKNKETYNIKLGQSLTGPALKNRRAPVRGKIG